MLTQERTSMRLPDESWTRVTLCLEVDRLFPEYELELSAPETIEAARLLPELGTARSRRVMNIVEHLSAKRVVHFYLGRRVGKRSLRIEFPGHVFSAGEQKTFVTQCQQLGEAAGALCDLTGLDHSFSIRMLWL